MRFLVNSLMQKTMQNPISVNIPSTIMREAGIKLSPLSIPQFFLPSFYKLIIISEFTFISLKGLLKGHDNCFIHSYNIVNKSATIFFKININISFLCELQIKFDLIPLRHLTSGTL